MKTTVYNQNGEKVREITLPENVFGLPWNSDLVHQVLVSLQSNMRTVIAHTKDRGDVRGGGIKPWRQKGTGRARHGSRRSPLWRGGGVTFGPTNERNFAKKINKKMRAKALYVLLSRKFKSGEVIFVDSLSFSEPKSSGAKTIIEALARSTEHPDLATKRKNAIFLALGKRDDNVKKSFSNFGNVALDEVRNLNALDIATSKYVIITHPEESIEFLSKRQSPSELILAEAGARA